MSALLRHVFVAVLVFSSSIATSQIEVSNRAAAHHRPLVLKTPEGESPWVQTSSADDQGISINEFATFDFERFAPRITADTNTKTLIVRVTGGKRTEFKDVHGIAVEGGSGEPNGVTLVVENPAGVYCNNCTVVGSPVIFSSTRSVAVTGSGMKATQAVTLKGGIVHVFGPLLAHDVSIQGKVLYATKDIYAERELAIQLKSALFNEGWMQALVVTIDTPTLENRKGHRVGIAALDPDQKVPGQLKLVSRSVTNDGHLISDGELDVDAKIYLINRGKIGSKGVMQLATDRFENYEDVVSGQKMTLTGPSCKRARAIKNISGRIRSDGSMVLEADEIKNCPAGFEEVKKVLTSLERKETPVVVSLPADEKPSEHPFLEVKKTQRFLEQPVASVIKTNGDLTIDADRIDNVLSRFEIDGDIRLARPNATEIIQHSAELRTTLDLPAADVEDVSLAGLIGRQPVSIVACAFNPPCWFAATGSAIIGPNWRSRAIDDIRRLGINTIAYLKNGNEKIANSRFLTTEKISCCAAKAAMSPISHQF